jgi:molybdenum cofactor synthesis domain-containing protein
LKTNKPTSQRALDSARPAPRVRPQRGGPLHLEIIAVGRDLLRGHVTETNGAAIAKFFAERGGLVHRITVIDDSERVVETALREALDRNPHLVVLTGGLGPAPDDVTLAGVARTLGQPLTLSQVAREMVEETYQELARTRRVRSAGMNLAREKMCRIPVGSTPLANTRGIPPGVLCKLPGGSAVLCLPGAPDESAAMLRESTPLLHELLPRGHTARREVEAPFPDESMLRPLLEQMASEFPGLWVTSRPVKSGRHRETRVLVSFEATAPSEEDANTVVSGAVRRLLAIVGGAR